MTIKRFKTLITLIIALFVASSVKASVPIDTISVPVDAVIAQGEQLLGLPYRYPLNNLKLDCSGFIKYIFSEFDYDTPRTASALSALSTHIPLNEVQKGDLLFFKGRNSRSKYIHHVSMVIENDHGKIKMMHSCRRGIIIDEFPRSYYDKRFLFAGRLPVSYTRDDAPMEYLSPIMINHIDDGKQYFEVSMDSVLPDQTDTARSCTIIGVGDIMLGTNFPSAQYLPPNQGKDLLKPVSAILQDADLTFGNLEGGYLTGKGPVKTCKDPKNCYAFKSPDNYVQNMVDAGFDVVSLANNHSGDFGNIGRENTHRVLTQAGIHFAGHTAYESTIFTKNGVTYGFCAFAPNEGTIRITDLDNAKRIVSGLDSVCDVVIVSFHGGAEGSDHTHITRNTETYLGENRGNPYLFARTVIDAGADLVFGNGPHVTRALDLYKGRLIAYSLGNFATYGRFSLSGVCGIAPILKVTVAKDGRFERAQVYSTKQVKPGGPVLDENNGALKELIRLTKEDIPECQLQINEDGSVLPLSHSSSDKK